MPKRNMNERDDRTMLHESGEVRRRTLAKGMAWSVPVIAATAVAPMAAATSLNPTIKILGVSCVMVGNPIASVQVATTGNTAQKVTFTLPAGAVWVDGDPSPSKVIGTGVGTFSVPSFTLSASTSSMVSFVATTGPVQDVTTGAVVNTYKISFLGGMNSIADGPDEFRADFTIDVPTGVRPTGLAYSFDPTGATIGTGLAKLGGDNSTAVRNSVDQAYGIEHVQSLTSQGCGSMERLYIHARGDADVNNIPTGTYQWKVKATWGGNLPDTIGTYDVLQIHRGTDGRPVAVNAWDFNTSSLSGYVGPNAEAGWGNIIPESSASGVNPNVFHIDALVSGRTPAEGNDLTTTVYYQFVHSDGTPASFTSTPRLITIPNHTDYIGVKGVLLGTADPTLGSSLFFDKPGYWKLLIWPQSSNSLASNQTSSTGVAWNPGSEMGQQVGSVFWHIPA